MSFDFPAVLVLATLVTGVIWAADAMFFAKCRAAQASGGETKEPVAVEWSRSFFPVIFVVLILRSFVAEPFRIPSGSMMPTLLVGDFILVNKFSYGLRLPVADTKVIELGSPKRGDVVVFRYPKNPSIDYIKRVVGIPGDKVGYFNKQLYINGNPIKQKSKGVYIGDGAGAEMTGASLRDESLEGVEHEILVVPDSNGMEGEIVVPKGQYFVMGDNRDRSNDSRYWGTVSDKHLVGKAFFIWMNWDWNGGGVQWQRIGSSID
ncbi:signal peptidase I [Solemya pervernicosa gill symbiont]|uniref:Signal peptidase I n=2 Tax=Gammaproteobacteria incertae sedis TaxID=118884 RepID=A0A1T2LA91_9GAMM|nr:signal peptidase I [Candidatus Reidiella endopervernicosa]OOZ42027.1 signal peptidase I [Solemya pervernicosa gill symbiont]QKQ27031.1 signal peptidase I [Candidatus Reidiella endopervernicosa]